MTTTITTMTITKFSLIFYTPILHFYDVFPTNYSGCCINVQDLITGKT